MLIRLDTLDVFAKLFDFTSHYTLANSMYSYDNDWIAYIQAVKWLGQIDSDTT